MKNTGLNILYKIQCMYQQKLISNEDKNCLAGLVKDAMRTGDYRHVAEKLYGLEVNGNEQPLWDALDLINCKEKNRH